MIRLAYSRAVFRAWVFTFPHLLWSQTAANISGVLSDPSGAVLKDGKVSAINLERKFVRVAISNATGEYVLSGLPAGNYELRVERNGFRPVVRKNVELTVAQQLRLDFTLELGDMSQEVTVTGQASSVNTSTHELSYLVGENAIRELPLNGRNWTDLALLQPGVVAYPHRDGGSVVAHGLGMSINGQDPRSNVYLLDGTPMNDFTNGPAGSAASTALGTETIREFRVEVNSYSAEFGRNSGGQFNVLTKSGTNDFHGGVVYFHRNDNLDSRDYFDDVRPEFKRNQLGATLGGPIRRDKSFFFVGYETLRERKGRTILTIVPDLAARSGQIAPIDPVIRPYLEAFPLPTPGRRSAGFGLGEHIFRYNQLLDQNFGQARYDHNLSERSQLFVRYTADDAAQELPTDYPQFPRTFLSRNQFLTAEHRVALSNSLLNTLRASFSRTRIGQDVQANLNPPLPAFVPGRTMMGGIDIGGIPGRFGPQTSVNVKLTQNIFGIEDGVSYNRGAHLFKFGAMAERYRDNMVNPTFALGIFTFASITDFLQNRPQRYLGLDPRGALDRYWRFTLSAFYAQDTWRVSRRLTLNLGVRYEFSTTPIDIYGRDSALINLMDPAPTVGQLYQNPTYRNISPRVGIAWDPSGDGKTAVRAGYGIYWNTNNQQNLIVTVTNPPATPRLIIANPTFPVPQFERGVGNTIRPVEWNIKNPYVQVWNINVQRQLPFDTLVTFGYAGSRGIHLWRSTDANTAIPIRREDGTLFFPLNAPRQNPAFSTIELKKSDGNSWYNAFLWEVRKRWNSGFSFQSSYTFSRNIDTTQASTFFSDATNGTTTAMPEYPGFQYNKGLADYHAKHNWVMNYSWAIPFAKSLRGVQGKLLDGWELAGIAQARSGNPLTVFVARNRSRSQWSPSLGPGLGFDRPSMAPGFTHQSAILGSPDRYFDPAAFVLPPAGTLGNLGRGALIGPNLRNVDFALIKNTRWAKLGESGNIQFRCEVFNLFNRANFGVPSLLAFTGAADNEAPLGSLGRIRTTVTSSRQIQFALRFAF
ncbi:MAG: TonB-dependent receptor [Bryobacteraceae bacterium]|nr:TonB-dependent receptor [Bryobacteraceae bacterium]MDW8379949.1 carboxypeptidase regulatory-like domain-containing protein [Bryobacterales bacterium]